MLTSMCIKEEDEENWVKSSSSSGQSTPEAQKQVFPTPRHINLEEPASLNGDVMIESKLPSSKHEEILKWSKTIPQTLDVEKKLKSSPKRGNNVKLLFLSNDGHLFSGETSNLGVKGLKTSMPGSCMCKSADPRLTRGTSGVGRRGTPGATTVQKPVHRGKDSTPRTPGRDPKISVNDMHQVTGNLVDSSIYYSGERKNTYDSRSKGAPTKSASGKEPTADSAMKQENETTYKQTLQSASHSVLGNMRCQSQRSSGVMRPWTTSSRIGDHAECTRSISNALLNVLTIDDCQLHHMYRERVRFGSSRVRVGSSHSLSRRGSRPQSSKTESGIFDLKSVSSGTSERRRNNHIHNGEEESVEHRLDNTKGDYDLPPELLILLEEHAEYPSEAVRRGFAALLDKDVMNNTCRTGLYKFDKSCKRKLNCGNGTDLFMRMKAMLRYHMLVNESAPSRLRMTKALKMHHGERYQEYMLKSENGRLENLPEVSDVTD